MTLSQADWRRLAWLALGLYLLGLAISATLRNQGDFQVYYLAGARALHGQPLYQAADKAPYLYAPTIALWFAPLALMPLHAAQFAWFAINAACLLLLLKGAARLALGPGRALDSALLVIPVLLVARFINNNIDHGQINLLVFALIVWAMARAQEDSNPVAGLWLAMAALIKPYALVAGLWMLLRGRIRPLWWAALWGCLILALPALVYGPRYALGQIHDYLRAAAAMRFRYRAMMTNQSASAAAIRLLADPQSLFDLGLGMNAAAALGLLVDVGLLAAVAAWVWRTRRAAAGAAGVMATAAMFCVMPSLAPVSWKSYFVALLVPYLALTALQWPAWRQWWTRHSKALPQGAALVTGLIVLSALLNNLTPGKVNKIALFYSVHLLSSVVVLAALAMQARYLPTASESIPMEFPRASNQSIQ